MEHILRNNETLRRSMSEGVSDALLNQLQDTKEWIESQKEEGFIVALVHLSGDLTHSAHIAYMNTIRAKLRKEIGKPFKLVVGLEADFATEGRKNKENVFKEEERKYIFENLKAVDKSFIEREGLDEQSNDRRPAGIVEFLSPNVMVSHTEHIGEDEDMVREQVKSKGMDDLVVVHYGDEERYLGEESKRDKFSRSTTNTIKQVLTLYKDNPKYNSFVSSQQ